MVAAKVSPCGLIAVRTVIDMCKRPSYLANHILLRINDLEAYIHPPCCTATMETHMGRGSVRALGDI